MTLNPDNYRIQVPAIKVWIESKQKFDFAKEVGLIAVATGTPIIVVSYFIGEIMGFNEMIHNKIKSDMKFYNIDKFMDYSIKD